MNHRTCSCLAVVFSLAAASLTAEDKLDFDRTTPVPAGQAIPLQDFFRPPLFSHPILNSSGTHFLAQVDVGNDKTALLVCDLAKLKLSVINGYKNEDVDWFSWLDDRHVLTSLITEKRYAKGLYINDAFSVRDVYPVELFSAASLVGVPTKAPMKPLIWIYHNAYDEGKNLGVLQIDAWKRLGSNSDALPGSQQDQAALDEITLYGTRAKVLNSFADLPRKCRPIEYLADKDGELAFAITVEDGVFSLYRYTRKDWVKTSLDLDQFYPLAVGDKPNELIVIGPRQDGVPRALQRLDAATGQLGELLLQDKAYDITSALFYRQPASRTIVGVKYDRTTLQTTWLNEQYATVQKMLNAQFPGRVVSILGSDQGESRFFFSTFSDRQPVTYYSLDLKAKTVGLIKSSAPWIDPERMQPTMVLKTKTRDGHLLECFLTLPTGATKENPPPVVVLSHGGPHSRDTWGYDGEVQFLASRGYAVLQTNYRGSTGYDWMFPAADNWDFRKMHEDVTDAAKALGKAGLIDSKRMAIMGTSFGGYLAMCGAAFEPDLYRCAITIAGVFDWTQMIKEKKSTQYENAAYGIFLRNLGDPRTHRAEFDAISPLRHVDQIKIPVFVAHGKDDEVADVEESRALLTELEKYHVPHDALLVAGEGHGMSHAKNQIELYGRIAAFLDQNLMHAK